MQPIDPEHPLWPNVQVAASIRSAILSGELEPGEQLPSGQELAKFFGVTRVTIGNAVRTLRDEGFVRTKTGSGVYVRDQASLPVAGESDHPLSGVASFLFEMGHLKRVPRSGWLLLGVPQPETIAEHRSQGHDTAAWQETSIGALRTDAAKHLAQAISSTDPRWWSAFAASYRELCASAQGRTRSLRG